MAPWVTVREPRRSPRAGRARPADAEHAERDEALAALRRVYADVDALLAGWSCDASTDCCRFGVTGREPYPTAVELAALERAVRARGGLGRSRSLPLARDERRCALLSDAGRCLVYDARPFGCRTFFCDRAEGPAGARARDMPRAEIAALGRAVMDISARFAPADPGPRPLSRASASWTPRGGRR